MESINFGKKELNDARLMAFNAAIEVAPTLQENFGKTSYKTKSSERDWVTRWDGWAEEKIADLLKKFAADVGIIGEENGRIGCSEVYWTIDAIDGTSGFVRGIDTCTTMIALVDNGVPVASVIYDFMRQVPYTATAGGGAFKNKTERIRVSNRRITQAYIETYLPEDTFMSQQVSIGLHKAGAYILQTGSSGHMFNSIARGATEGFLGVQNPFATVWDYAPGALLVHEAGGRVVNIGSDTYDVTNPDMIASNRLVFDALTEVVKRI